MTAGGVQAYLGKKFLELHCLCSKSLKVTSPHQNIVLIRAHRHEWIRGGGEGVERVVEWSMGRDYSEHHTALVLQ